MKARAAAMIVVCCCAALTAARGQQSTPRPKPVAPPPKRSAPAPRPAVRLPGALLIEVDAPARIEVDDQTIGLVRPEALKRVPVALGQHVVRATSTELQTVRVRQVANVDGPGQVVVRLEMLPELLVPRPCGAASPKSTTASAEQMETGPPAMRVGMGTVTQPQKIKHVPPAYPSVAQSARIQGVVIVEATIGPTGKVEGACILRSIPMLDASAIAAVRQWEFTPTKLNDTPVSVIMTVTVNFKLE